MGNKAVVTKSVSLEYNQGVGRAMLTPGVCSFQQNPFSLGYACSAQDCDGLVTVYGGGDTNRVGDLAFPKGRADHG